MDLVKDHVLWNVPGLVQPNVREHAKSRSMANVTAPALLHWTPLETAMVSAAAKSKGLALVRVRVVAQVRARVGAQDPARAVAAAAALQEA